MNRWTGLIALIGLVAAAPVMGRDTAPLNQRQARTSPEWLTGGVIYQIQPRAFTPEGTLKAAESRLPRPADLGVTVLYLCHVLVADDDMDRASWSPRQKASGMNNPRNRHILALVNLTAKPVSLNVQGLAGPFQTLLTTGVHGDGQHGFSLSPHGYFVGKRWAPRI